LDDESEVEGEALHGLSGGHSRAVSGGLLGDLGLKTGGALVDVGGESKLWDAVGMLVHVGDATHVYVSEALVVEVHPGAVVELKGRVVVVGLGVVGCKGADGHAGVIVGGSVIGVWGGIVDGAVVGTWAGVGRDRREIDGGFGCVGVGTGVDVVYEHGVAVVAHAGR